MSSLIRATQLTLIRSVNYLFTLSTSCVSRNQTAAGKRGGYTKNWHDSHLQETWRCHIRLFSSPSLHSVTQCVTWVSNHQITQGEYQHDSYLVEVWLVRRREGWARQVHASFPRSKPMCTWAHCSVKSQSRISPVIENQSSYSSVLQNDLMRDVWSGCEAQLHSYKHLSSCV